MSPQLLPTAFALSCLGVSAVRPSGKDSYVGEPAPCGVCGAPSDAHRQPWLRSRSLSDNFAALETYAVSECRTVCGACTHKPVGSSFHAAVMEHVPPAGALTTHGIPGAPRRRASGARPANGHTPAENIMTTNDSASASPIRTGRHPRDMGADLGFRVERHPDGLRLVSPDGTRTKKAHDTLVA